MNNKNILKLIVDREEWVPVKYTGTPEQYLEAKEKNELDRNSWWYLHGELQYLVGYDKAWATNCKSAGYSKETIDYSCIRGDNVCEVKDENNLTCWKMHVNDIIPVQVKGIDEPCIGYFWTTEHSPVYYKDKAYPYWDQRGLVCLESDMEAREYALTCFNNKEICI